MPAKTLRLFQVDAFTDRLFAGNPAAVCPLESWLPDALMQAIAAENNLAETAFVVPQADGFGIRWFTPKVEVALCGHATLASAHVLFTHLGVATDVIRFHSHHSGLLPVERNGSWLTLDFPANAGTEIPAQAAFGEALGASPAGFFRGKTDIMLVFDAAETVRRLQPDFRLVSQLPVRGLIVTAPGDEPELDFVSRFFAPQSGIDEDPVTGSSFTMLLPYWSQRLGKEQLTARQVSARGGQVQGQLRPGGRVGISGQAVTYLVGEIFV